MQQYVIYTRVSTKEQGKSGLGLEAQERDINHYLSNHPGEVIGRFNDVESGKNDERAELQKALLMVRATGAELLVSKLDRLSRDLAMIANLMKDRDVAFRVTSMPGADSMMIGIYAVLAQKEREMISERTRAALKSARERGIKLGGARAGGVEKSAESRIAKADQGAERAYHIVRPLRDAGLSFRKIAHNLNAMGLKTAGGSDWEARSVLRVIERMEKTL